MGLRAARLDLSGIFACVMQRAHLHTHIIVARFPTIKLQIFGFSNYPALQAMGLYEEIISTRPGDPFVPHLSGLTTDDRSNK